MPFLQYKYDQTVVESTKICLHELLFVVMVKLISTTKHRRLILRKNNSSCKSQVPKIHNLFASSFSESGKHYKWKFSVQMNTFHSEKQNFKVVLKM